MDKTTIFKKLLAFQKLNISVKKDGKNPHFKSNYATLNEVLDKVKEPLNKLGIVIIFAPETDGLRTILFDTESETKIEGFMKYIDCGNAQKLLSCNTYFRRGSLVSLLGLEDEDDDGNKASAPIVEWVKPKAIMTEQQATDLLKACTTLPVLATTYKTLTVPMQKQMEFLKNELKEQFTTKCDATEADIY